MSDDLQAVPQGTIYLVTEGSYSEYSVVAAFSTRALAEEFIQRFMTSAPDARVEECSLNPAIREARNGLNAFDVYMRRDGELIQEPSAYNWIGEATFEVVPCEVTARWAERFREEPVFHCECWARDAQHAIKIANDRRAQMIALGEWPEEVE